MSYVSDLVREMSRGNVRGKMSRRGKRTGEMTVSHCCWHDQVFVIEHNSDLVGPIQCVGSRTDLSIINIRFNLVGLKRRCC